LEVLQSEANFIFSKIDDKGEVLTLGDFRTTFHGRKLKRLHNGYHLLSLIFMKKLINSKLCLKKPQKLLMICLLRLFYLIGLSSQILLHLGWIVLQGLIGLQTARYCLHGHD
jgi:hypothetical protein